MLSLTTTIIILLTAALFLIGAVVGWVASSHGDEDATKSKIKIVVAIAVTLVWISATLAGIVLPAYTVSPMVHALMGAIVGYFFTDNGITLNLGGSK